MTTIRMRGMHILAYLATAADPSSGEGYCSDQRQLLIAALTVAAASSERRMARGCLDPSAPGVPSAVLWVYITHKYI